MDIYIYIYIYNYCHYRHSVIVALDLVRDPGGQEEDAGEDHGLGYMHDTHTQSSSLSLSLYKVCMCVYIYIYIHHDQLGRLVLPGQAGEDASLRLFFVMSLSLSLSLSIYIYYKHVES